MRRAQALVFLRVDVPLGLLGRPARLVELQFTAHALDQAQLVVAVEDLEVLRQPGVLPVRLEQAMGQTVEGADPHAVGGYCSMCSMRPRISRAALLVKVTASSPCGDRPSARISQAMRCTSTRVLPEPAPASTSSCRCRRPPHRAAPR
jgi:hypothetical protein